MGKYNLKYQIAAGVILVISGTLVLLSDYIKEKRDVVFSEMNLALSGIDEREDVDTLIEPVNEEVPSEEEEVVSEEVNNEESYEDNGYTYEEYIGIIDIPKIDLYKGFYSKTSSLNNVKFNLYVLPESSYPDTVNGNLIIAGHSGNYNNSYFGNLYKLEKDDTIIIVYNGKRYIYKVVNIYIEEKTGTVRIFRNKNETTLTLITCTKDDDYHQTIYISELIDIE